MATNTKGMAMPTMTEQSEKVRENRLREAAKRQGLKIGKSRQRDPRGLTYGRWTITTDLRMNGLEGTPNKPRIERFNVTLDEVEAYLMADRGER